MKTKNSLTERTEIAVEATDSDIDYFRISYRSGAYYVSIPRYQGGDVVRKEDYDALLAELNDLKAWKESAWPLFERYDALAESFSPQVGESKVAALEGGVAELRAERDALREALERIERWFGEFPMVRNREGRLIPYGTAYGSNGERDYMRDVARTALLNKEGER